MEVIEIDDYFVNKENNMLTVSFRMVGDYDNTVRQDIIEYTYLQDFGYDFEIDTEEFDVFDDEWDEWDDEDDTDELILLDEDDLRSFLNEYYVVFPDKIPSAEVI